MRVRPRVCVGVGGQGGRGECAQARVGRSMGGGGEEGRAGWALVLGVEGWWFPLPPSCPRGGPPTHSPIPRVDTPGGMQRAFMHVMQSRIPLFLRQSLVAQGFPDCIIIHLGGSDFIVTHWTFDTSNTSKSQ